MPSLRRTTSSPVVRANPYPTSLSSSHSSHLSMGLLRPRRTASDTVNRRVLADIEWWRVLDGQHQEEPDFEQEQEIDIIEIVQDGVDVMGVAFDDQPVAVNLDSATSRLSTPVDQNVFELNAGSHIISFRAELTISAIAPSTPVRNRGSRGSSGDSSTESTPEPELPDFRTRFFDEDISETVPNAIHHSHFEHLGPACSMSLSGLTAMSNIEDRFGDVAIAL